MERFCFTFSIRPGVEDEYKRRHEEIWPELVDAMAQAGLSNYTLFRRDQKIIAYVECEPDARTALNLIGATEIQSRWVTEMEEFIVALTDEHGRLHAYEEVWHLD